MQTRVIVVIVAAIVIALGAGLWWWKAQSTALPNMTSKAQEQAQAPAPPAANSDAEIGEVPATPEVQTAHLPPLDASDDYVRQQVAPLSPAIDDWLKQDDLVNRFAALIDNARVGNYPRRQLAFLAPQGKFAVTQQGDKLLLDPAGYHRFDGMVDAAVSVDPKQAAATLRTLAPLLVDALKNLGAKDPDPIEAMRQAIDIVLATPEVEGEVLLVQPKVYYQFADKKLESLKPLQKQLLRMGPQNLDRIKTYAAQIKADL